jgi:uncharacterized metal-binding protein YceD (DUF177 family)
MKNERSYSIAVSGLPAGKHFFNFEIDDAFFVGFEESEVQHAAVKATVTVDKSSILLQLETLIDGNVTLPCDRCLDDLTIPVSFRGTPVVQFMEAGDNEDYANDEDILWMNAAESELDLTQYLYDSIILSLPLQRTHPEEDCNEEMIKKLNELKLNINKL